MRQTIIWTNDGLAYWRIYVSLGRNELGRCVYGENIDNMYNTKSFTFNEMVHLDKGYWTWDAQIYVTYV